MASPSSITFSDELQQLRWQVDKLRERLDFMAPMLSLLNFTQDFFQRVECEASVQLLRLKNAKVAGQMSAEASDTAEEPNMVDTARWLHTMTDLVMSLQSCRKEKSGDSQRQASECAGQMSPSQMMSVRRAAHSPLGSERTPPQRDALPQARPVLAKGSSKGSAAGGTSAFANLLGGSGGHGSTASAASGTSASSASSATAGASSARTTGKELKGFEQPKVREGIPLRAGVDSTLEVGGLSLGRGTWANAYRQAKGSRRDALRLLCSTGIVTERELADDLTVISEEHVEECISIAGEMLRRWPIERCVLPIAEAKSFFEERLAALYMSRAPTPFGAH